MDLQFIFNTFLSILINLLLTFLINLFTVLINQETPQLFLSL